MRAALISEARKLTTTQLWWIVSIVMAAYMAMLGAMLAFSFTIDPESMQGGSLGSGSGSETPALTARQVAEAVYTLAPTLGYVFPLVMGALAMTGEYRHRTITVTVLAEPRRSVVLVAKLVVQFVFGAVLGLLGTAGAVLGGAAVLMVVGEPTLLGDSGIWANIGWSVVALALWGVIGVGVGTLVPNQVASVVGILVFTQLVEPLLRLGLAAIEGAGEIAKYLPGAAAEALAGASLYSASGLAELLGRWQGGLVLLGYALALALAGRLTTMRRDIT